MLHKKLKDACDTRHKDLESLMYVDKIMSGNLTIHDYSRLLIINQHFHNSLESKFYLPIDKLIHDNAIVYENKSQLLNKDLDDLSNYTTVNYAVKLPLLDVEFENEQDALGVLYVTEGATLGGAVIYKQLKKNVDLNHLSFNYYQVYGSETFVNWKKFCQVLDEVPALHHDKIIDVALQTFDYIIDTAKTVNSLI